MKILVLNPNTSEIFTGAIQAGADHNKSIGTEIVAMNPKSGPRSIESRYDEILSCQPSLDVIISNEADFDGFIIACYGDHPVIYPAREITHKPVLGIMEASIYMACMVGYRFSVVGDGDERHDPLFWETLRHYGVAERCASSRRTGLAVLDLETPNDEQVRKRIFDEARKAVDEDGAEVICLGCAGMVGFDKELQNKLGVPVIDGVVAAIKLIEALVGYGIGTSKRGGYARPLGKDLLNMPSIFQIPYAKG
jgi:allantoin racemase